MDIVRLEAVQLFHLRAISRDMMMTNQCIFRHVKMMAIRWIGASWHAIPGKSTKYSMTRVKADKSSVKQSDYFVPLAICQVL